MYWLPEYAFPSFSRKKQYKCAAVPRFLSSRNVAFPSPLVAPLISTNTGVKERFPYSTTTTRLSSTRAEGKLGPFSHVNVTVSSSPTIAAK